MRLGRLGGRRTGMVSRCFFTIIPLNQETPIPTSGLVNFQGIFKELTKNSRGPHEELSRNTLETLQEHTRNSSGTPQELSNNN
jgi:hypothetical protein